MLSVVTSSDVWCYIMSQGGSPQELEVTCRVGNTLDEPTFSLSELMVGQNDILPTNVPSNNSWEKSSHQCA